MCLTRSISHLDRVVHTQVLRTQKTVLCSQYTEEGEANNESAERAILDEVQCSVQ